MLKETDKIFGLELPPNSVCRHWQTLWLVRDKKGRIFELSKRKIKPLRKHGTLRKSNAVVEVVDGEECKTYPVVTNINSPKVFSAPPPICPVKEN